MGAVAKGLSPSRRHHRGDIREKRCTRVNVLPSFLGASILGKALHACPEMLLRVLTYAAYFVRFPGSLEGMIRGLSGTAIAEDEAGMQGEEGGQGEVKDLEHGVKQGGKVRGDASIGFQNTTVMQQGYTIF